MSAMKQRISRMAPPPRVTARANVRVPTNAEGLGSPRDYGGCEWASGDMPAWRRPGLVDRGQEATGGAIEGVSSILPGRPLTESRQSLDVTPHRTGIALLRLRQRVRLRGLLLRHFQSPNGHVDHCVPRASKLLGCGSQEKGSVMRSVRVERCANAVQRRRPRRLNRRAHVAAPEASHVLKPPNHVISAHMSIQKHVEGQGGG